MNNAQLIHSDCLSAMNKIDESSIDLTVTSPPYDNLRNYSNSLAWDDNIWMAIIKELYRITASGGVVVWVVGDATVKGNESGTSFKQALYFKEIGFNLLDTMIYSKSGGGAVGSNNAYWSGFEYMFVFTKGRLKTFNPIVDRKNKKKPSFKCETQSRRSTEENRTIRRCIQREEYGKRYNVWQYNTGKNLSTTDKEAFLHPAIFPEKLAEDHILSWSNVGDIVFDPFLGSGTTGKMALINNREFIGIEKEKKYFDIACKRIKKTTMQMTLSI